MGEGMGEGMRQGVICRIETGLFRYQAWPTVCRDEDGILYAVCSGHRLGHVCPFGKDLMYISRDEGETWSAPMIVNDTCMDDRDATIASLGRGRLLLGWFNHPREFYFGERKWITSNTDPVTHALSEGMLQAWEQMPPGQTRFGSFLRLSEDGGSTWGEARQVPVSSPHGPIRLKNGKLLYLGKEFHSGRYEKGAIFAFESADEGRTWECLSRVDFPDGCDAEDIHEPHAIELADGVLLGALRGQGKKVPYGFTVYICRSEDGGRSWTHPRHLDVCGSPPHLLLHSSGAVVMTYGRRRAPYGERARVSYDGGENFGEELIISAEAPDSDLGYPSSVELSDGSIFTVYYQKLPGDRFCSLLYTRWRLPRKK